MQRHLTEFFDHTGWGQLEFFILHYTKGTVNFAAQHGNPHKWGTVGSGLTPGSRPDGHTSPEPNGSGSRTEKRFQTVPPIFALLRHLGPHVGYRWVRADPRITPGWTDRDGTGSGSGKSGKTGKTVSRPFCFITAEPGHLQTW